MAAFTLQRGSILNFRDRTLVLPSTVIVVSLVVMLGTLLFGVFGPQPNVAGVAKTQTQIEDVNRQIAMLKTQEQQASAVIAKRVWQGDQNDVSASVLAGLTALAKQNGLALSSFRPQRTTDLTGITDLPLEVQLSGPYSGIRAMMRHLDASGSRLVLRSTQIIAATNSTTNVTVTLGLSAYLATDPAILIDPASSAKLTTKRAVSSKRGVSANGR